MANQAERLSFPLGPDSAGIRMTPQEFDEADFEDGWRYELIDQILVVSRWPAEKERDPNDELGYWLRRHRHQHLDGRWLDGTLHAHTVASGQNRRYADRVIWTGLGRHPRRSDVPSVLVDFLAAGKRDWIRDLKEKRDEYIELGVSEYWIIDRFQRQMIVYSKHGKRVKKQIVSEKQTYTTPLLPGFELRLTELLALADEWSEGEQAE